MEKLKESMVENKMEKFYSHSWWFQELYDLYDDLDTFKFIAVKYQYDSIKGPVYLELLAKAEDDEMNADEDIANYIIQHRYNAPCDHWLRNLDIGFNLQIRLVDFNKSFVLKNSHFLCGDKSEYEQIIKNESDGL